MEQRHVDMNNGVLMSVLGRRGEWSNARDGESTNNGLACLFWHLRPCTASIRSKLGKHVIGQTNRRIGSIGVRTRRPTRLTISGIGKNRSGGCLDVVCLYLGLLVHWKEVGIVRRRINVGINQLSFMRNDGHIDPDLFDLFLSSGIYRKYAEEHLLPEQVDDVDISAYIRSDADTGKEKTH